jgi:hypothetical protein
MAMVLILLLLGLWLRRDAWFVAAVALLLLTMIAPTAYRPVAIVWLGFSRLLGTVVSRILLTVIFLTVVTPVGLVRRLAGADSLRIKQFKKNADSVMVKRNLTYRREHIDKPY